MARHGRPHASSPLTALSKTIPHETRLFASLLASLTAFTAGAEAQSDVKLFSPDKSYSVEIMRPHEPNSDALVLFNGAKAIARIPASVGPVGSFFEVLWSPDGKYVAINKQRSSRPGGDEMWIVALPTGKVLRQPDDGLWNELDEKADAFIAEKGLNETGGKVFLTLRASGWEKDRLRCRLEAGFSEIETRYFFEGTVDPSQPETVREWKISEAHDTYKRANSTSTGNGDKPSDLAIKQKLLGYWKSSQQVYHIVADGKMYVDRGQGQTIERWNVKNGKFYWGNVPCTIVTLTDNNFVFREIGSEYTFALIRTSKEEVDPE